jgi:hypothetical protein
MESNKKSTGAKALIGVSPVCVDEIVEEIVTNLVPLRCAVVTADREVRRIIEQDLPPNFHNRPTAVKEYAERLQKWIAEGKTLLPKPSSSRVLEVELIPPEIRVKVLLAAGANFLDGLENWPYEQVEEWLAVSQDDGEDGRPYDPEIDPMYMSRVTHEYYKEFFRKIERLAAVAESGLKYRGPVDQDGVLIPFPAPQSDPIKQACASNALSLIIALSKKPPTSADEKNLRTIASLLYEAHGGQPNIDLERACDPALRRWRREGSYTYKEPTIPHFFIAITDANGRIVETRPPGILNLPAPKTRRRPDVKKKPRHVSDRAPS